MGEQLAYPLSRCRTAFAWNTVAVSAGQFRCAIGSANKSSQTLVAAKSLRICCHFTTISAVRGTDNEHRITFYLLHMTNWDLLSKLTSKRSPRPLELFMCSRRGFANEQRCVQTNTRVSRGHG